MSQMNLHAGNTRDPVQIARDGKVRQAILGLYASAATNWAYARNALERGLRGPEARRLLSWQRRFVGEAVYSLVRFRRRLEFAVGSTEPLKLYLAWLRLELEPSEVLDAELRVNGLTDEMFDSLDVRIGALSLVEQLSIGLSYPDWLVEHLLRSRSHAETQALLSAMNHRALLAARVNLLKGSREDLIARLAQEKVPAHAAQYSAAGIILETHVNAYGLEAFKEGRFELQDVGSQLIAEVCAPPPRGLVVDACAGAGGKTLALGALLENRGRLIAFDVSERKLTELRERARRAGLTNVSASLIDAENPVLPEKLVGACDRVLCDAPCSGVGVLRRNPEARWRLQPKDLEELPPLQLSILKRYAPLVAPGGRLIYGTCTVTPEENDQVVDKFLAADSAFEEVSIKEILGSARAREISDDGIRLRVLPHTHDTDGFFAAVMRRKR